MFHTIQDFSLNCSHYVGYLSTHLFTILSKLKINEPKLLTIITQSNIYKVTQELISY